MEGGAYGHMKHPFDDKDLTFGDLKKIIENGLGGTLSREDGVTEKLDGQNIMVSWKDGKLIGTETKDTSRMVEKLWIQKVSSVSLKVEVI